MKRISLKAILVLLTFSIVSQYSMALDPKRSGAMKDEHIIVEGAQIQVLPQSEDLRSGRLTMKCAEGNCQFSQVNYDPSSQIFVLNGAKIDSAGLLNYTGKTADVTIKRGTERAAIIRIYK